MDASTTTTQADRSVAPSVADQEKPMAPSDSSSHSDNEKLDRPVQPAANVAEEELAASDSEDEKEYPKAWKLALISIALCLSVFCMALDNTIIATAIPRITDEFQALNDVGWYASAYLLTTCALQLIFGKLYTFYSIKWVYLIALFIFEVGSLICGIAPNSTALIIGRAIAGVGSAGIFSGAILIVAHTVPLRKRPTYTGFIGGMYGVASVAGPLMGGAFTDRLTWRWCFYINLPFGGVTALFIIFFFNSPKRAKKAVEQGWKQKLEQFDLIGTILFLPAVVCLLLALQWGGSQYAWSNGRIIALFILFGVLIIGFVIVQLWKQEYATVPPRVFKNRNVWGASVFGASLGAAFFLLIYFIPIWFQAIKGVSAVMSGIMNLPMILGLVIMSILSGAAVSIFGYYTPFIYGSVVFMAIGAGLLTTFQVDTGSPAWIGYQALFGIGVGLGMQQPLMVVQTVLPDADVPIGTAIIMFAQILGGALFVSVGQNIFTNQLIQNLGQFPEIPAGLVLATGATELRNAVSEAVLPAILTAYNTALTRTWYVSVATAAFSAIGASVIQWKSMKGKKIAAVAAA